MKTVPIQILFVDQFGSLGGTKGPLNGDPVFGQPEVQLCGALNGQGEFHTQLMQSGFQVMDLPSVIILKRNLYSIESNSS